MQTRKRRALERRLLRPVRRFDENMLIANISELPFERRKAVLDEGLNTLLSVQLFEVSQHLDSAGKVDVFRFISDQKAVSTRS